MASATNEDKLDVCCLTEYRPLPGDPQGKLIEIAQIKTYCIEGQDPKLKGKAIVLLSDVFGLTKNPRLTADEISMKSGFDVYVPDLFNGDPIPSGILKDIPDTPGEKLSFGTKLSLAGKFFTSFGPWLFRHRQAITLPLVENFIKTLRTERQISKIQAVGYCFGGLYALILAGYENRLVDAIVACHPSQTNKMHYEKVEVPIALACAQEDNQFSDAFRAEVEEILKRKSNIPRKVLLTEGTVHGYAARPNPENPVIMKAYEQTNHLIVEWAQHHL